jgi:hypothetical protein
VFDKGNDMNSYMTIRTQSRSFLVFYLSNEQKTNWNTKVGAGSANTQDINGPQW